MEAVLPKWISGTVHADSENDTESLIDRDVLEILKQLADGQYLDIIESYLEFARIAIVDITNAVNAGDVKAVKDNAHSLKASSLQVGAIQLGDLSAELETHGMNEELDEIKALMHEFTDVGGRVLTEFETYLDKHKTG